MVDGPTGAHDSKQITFSLSGPEYERLRAAADRSQIAIEEMVKEILRGPLKFF